MFVCSATAFATVSAAATAMVWKREKISGRRVVCRSVKPTNMISSGST